MTSSEFITWFRGFVQAANGYNITPKQWDDIKEKLTQVNDASDKVVFSRYTMETNTTTTNDRVLLTDNKVL